MKKDRRKERLPMEQRAHEHFRHVTAAEVVAEAEKLMPAQPRRRREQSLSQRAAEVSWKFMTSQQSTDVAPQAAREAIELCDMLAAAAELISDTPSAERPLPLGFSTTRLLLSDRAILTPTINMVSRSLATAKDNLLSIKSGQAKLKSEELKNLQSYFATLSLILEEQDL